MQIGLLTKNSLLKKGAKFSSISMTQFNFNSIVMNQSELFESEKRFMDWFESRNKIKLDNSEMEKLNSFYQIDFKVKK